MRERAAFAILLMAAFMGVLDAFIVSIGMPTIERNLAGRPAELEFILVAYILAYAGSLILGGRAGDRWGHARMFLIGVAGFTLTSLACALAGTIDVLVAARLFQGLAAGLMLPQVMALIRLLNEDPERRTRAMGVYMAVLGFAALSGQLIGALILAVGNDSAWRGFFLINLPVGLLILAASRALPAAAIRQREDLDFGGAVAQIIGSTAVLAALILGTSGQMGPQMAVALALAGLAVLAGFLRWEIRLERDGRRPLIPPAMFKEGNFRTGLAAVFLYYLSAPLQVAIAYHLQHQLGLSALAASLVFLPYGATLMISSLRSARTIQHYGRELIWRALLISSAILFAGVFVAPLMPERFAPPLLAGALAVVGLFQGVVAGPLLALAIGQLPPRVAGVGSGVVLAAVQFGNACGVALILGIFFAMTVRAPADALWQSVGACLPFILASALLTRKLVAGPGQSVGSAKSVR